MIKKISLIILLLVLGLAATASAAALDNWHWRNPLPEGNTLNGLSYGNGTFVAVGGFGSIFTSTDKSTWVKRDSGITDSLNDVTFGDNMFIAVGSGNILTSQDGIEWVKRSTLQANCITYGKGLFVAVSGDNIITSADGVTWNQKAAPVPNAGLSRVGYANNLFVAFGGWSGSATIITSPDGGTWSTRLSGTAEQMDFGGFSYGNGVFILSGWSQNNSTGYHDTVSYTSSDGVTWTKYVSNGPWRGIGYANGAFISVAGSAVVTSQDGVSWTYKPSGISGQDTIALIRAADAYFAVGGGGSIVSSTDGNSWSALRPGNRNALNSIAYGNNRLVAVSWDGTYTSTDGVAWAFKALPYGFESITFNAGTFAGVSGGGLIATSPDGITWTQQQSGVTGGLTGIAYGNNQYVAVGNVGVILTSPDARTWTKRSSGTASNLLGITWGNGQYVAVGDNETILTSSNGITWAHRDTGFAPGSPANRQLRGITYGAGMFAIAGQGGIGILTSPDGVTWQQMSSGADTKAITYGNNTFVAVGYNGTMVTSGDGITWTQHKITGNSLLGVVYGGNTFVIVGDGGTILQSDATSFSDPLDSWRWRNPLPEGNSLNGLAYGNGIFVTVGAGGGVFTSTDKITWTKQNSTTSANFSDITFGKGLFAAVGASPYVFTSPDGATWTRRSASWLNAVTFGNGQFVAVGNASIATSPDGIVWTIRTAPSLDMNLSAVTCGNGLFVAVDSNNRSILASADGITWTTRYSGGTDTAWLAGMAYGNGAFVVVGNNGTNGIDLVSTDGITWTQHVTNTPGNVTYVNGQFISINSNGVMTSPDGINWVSNSGISSSSTNAFIYAGNAYVAAGDGGAIAYSTDGTKWTDVRSGFHDGLASIAYGNNTYVVGSWNNRAYTSTDGVSWTANSANSMPGLLFNAGLFVGVGCGIVQTSGDGIIWNSRQSGVSECLKAVAYGNGLYVAAGDAGRLVTSADAGTWAQQSSGTSSNLMGVAYGNGLFVAVGSNETILTSPDGRVWTNRSTNFLQGTSWRDLRSITFNAGIFVIAGQGGLGILTSPDGVTWTQRDTSDFVGASYGNNTFVAVGYNGTMASSSNGMTWTHIKKTGNNLAAVVFGRDSFVAVGSGGTILQSDPASSSNPLDTWHWRNPLPEGDNLYGLAYGNGSYVAVGGYGTIFTSTDKNTWIRRGSGATDVLNGVTFGNGQFVAAGCGTILTSSDGVAWIKRSGVCADAGVAYGNGRYVAAGGGNQIYSSSDGITWTSRTPSIANPGLNRIGFANGIFVAFGHGSGKDIIMTSTDGTTWTTRYTGILEPGDLGGFAFGNGIFVISGWDGSGGITLTSPDGVVWTKHVTNTPYNGIAFADGLFRFVNSGGAMVSQDGVSWGQNATGLSTLGQDPTDVLFASGSYVVVGLGGSIVFSSDATSWTPVRSGFHDNFSSITYGNNSFVAVSGNAKSYVATDGVSWTGGNAYGFTRVTYNAGTLVGVGGNGMIATSSDGLKWTRQTSGVTDGLNGITFGDGLYVAVGSSGRVLTSPDAVTWTQRISNTTRELGSVAYGNGQYVAVGANEAVITSTDGITWTRHSTNFAPGSSDRSLQTVIYNAGMFVAVGGGDVGIITSTNGINWSQRYSHLGLTAIAYGNNTFVAVGWGGAMATSSDGITWSQKQVCGNNLYGIAYGRGTFVIVGDGGTILQSGILHPQSILTVSKTGNGSGMVTSNSSMISCGSSCVASFNQGSTVALTATPDPGKLFSGWSGGGGCSGTGSCTVTLDNSTAVTAVFGDNTDNTPPAVAITSPAGNDALNKLFFITGTADDDKSGVTKVEVQISEGSIYLTQDQTFTTSPTWIPVSGPLDRWTFNSSRANWANGTSYTIRARATDGAGNVSNTTTVIFNYISVSEQAYTTLSLDLSSQTIRQNETVTVTGKLSRLPEIGSNLSNNAILISVTDSNGAIRTYPATTYNSTGFYTASLSGFPLKGGYLVQASFSGSPTLASSSSDSRAIMVGASAGYAIIIEGKLNNNEGIDSHNKTLNRAYKQLKARGFLDDNIYYFNYNGNQPGIAVDAVPTKAAIQAAIEGGGPFNLRDKLNGSPTTAYIIMVNHGDVNQFHLGNEIITPTDMNQWLTTLENGLNANALQEKRVVIIGACYSGSFIDKLSKSGRTIITSAKANEESYKGPMEPDGIRSGEFFIESLFQNFGKSFDIKQAFSQAARSTAYFTKQGGVSSNTGGSPADKALQHPLLDDNGDGIGSNDLDAIGGDGVSTQNLYVGVGATYITNAANNPADILRVTDTVFLGDALTSATLWLTVNDNSLLSTSPWVEIRSPRVQLSGSGSSNQLEIDLPRAFLTFNEGTNRWEFISNAFTDSGLYEIYYYVQDKTTQAISTMKRSIVYKSKSGNSAPGAFSLTAPADQSEQKTLLLLNWQDSVDPDGDVVTYTLIVSRDSTFATIDYKQEEITYGVTSMDITANLSDLTTYYWKVQAMDQYGAITTSSQTRSFRTNNTNGLPAIITGYIRNNATGTPLASATYRIGSGSTNAVLPSGAFLEMLSTGATTLTVSATGYTGKTVNLILTPGSVTENNFYLSPATGTTPINGDCDNSGTVTIVEVQSAINMFLGITIPAACVDTNRDNIVSIVEVQKVINGFLGL